MTANNQWRPEQYDATFGFVTRHGAGVLDLLGEIEHQAVLDLGCGTGHLTAQLAARGAAPVVGVDLSADMIAAARRAHPALQFEVGDGQTMTLQSLRCHDPFDAVFSNAALHWMPDGLAVARSARGVLRRGGRFVAELGGQGNVAAVDAALRSSLFELGLASLPVPVQDFPSVSEQAGRLELGGFRVHQIRWFERPTELPEGITPAHWSQHFRAKVWADAPSDLHGALAAAINSRAEAAGLAGGGWHIDYCRLQFLAEAV